MKSGRVTADQWQKFVNSQPLIPQFLGDHRRQSSTEATARLVNYFDVQSEILQHPGTAYLLGLLSYRVATEPSTWARDKYFRRSAAVLLSPYRWKSLNNSRVSIRAAALMETYRDLTDEPLSALLTQFIHSAIYPNLLTRTKSGFVPPEVNVRVLRCGRLDQMEALSSLPAESRLGSPTGERWGDPGVRLEYVRGLGEGQRLVERHAVHLHRARAWVDSPEEGPTILIPAPAALPLLHAVLGLAPYSAAVQEAIRIVRHEVVHSWRQPPVTPFLEELAATVVGEEPPLLAPNAYTDIIEAAKDWEDISGQSIVSRLTAGQTPAGQCRYFGKLVERFGPVNAWDIITAIPPSIGWTDPNGEQMFRARGGTERTTRNLLIGELAAGRYPAVLHRLRQRDVSPERLALRRRVGLQLVDGLSERARLNQPLIIPMWTQGRWRWPHAATSLAAPTLPAASLLSASPRPTRPR